jgi:hypothetical protein
MITKACLTDLDWDKILEIERYLFAQKKHRLLTKFFLRKLLYVFLKRPVFGPLKTKTDFLFLKVMQRDDYQKLFDDICAQCHSDKVVADIGYEKSNFPSLRKLIYLVRHREVIAMLWRANGRKEFLFCMPSILEYLEVFDTLKRLSFRHLVVFADMQPIESLMVQAANHTGTINTVTLQHGLYIDYGEYDNINCTNYKNQVSRHFLAWGEATQNLIERWHEEVQVTICGKPIQAPEVDCSDGDYFTVLFDQNMMYRYNKEMLDICYAVRNETGLKLNIRFHPRNNPKRYIDETTDIYINQEIAGSRFIIAHTTSLIHELMRTGTIVYKYQSDIPSHDVPVQYTFATADGLLALLKDHQHDARQECMEYGKQYIRYIGDASLMKYRHFFERLSLETV